jgi:TolA-binding protein
MLADALEVEQAQVAPPPQPGAATQAPAPPGSYPTERARDEAALGKLMGVADAYPSSPAGITARYEAAAMLTALGRLPEAMRRYQEVVDRAGASVYAQMAKLGIAEAQAGTGHYDQAIAGFKEMTVRKDSQLPVDGILMQLGRAYAAAGRTADAQQTFGRIVDEFPLSPYSAEAKKELDAIKG